MRAALLVVLTLAFPVIASAGGINLSWNDCGSAGAMDRVFNCNSCAAPGVVVTVSFEPDDPIDDLVGSEALIQLQSADASTLNPWWQMFNAGSCRGTTVPSTNVVFGGGTCIDLWTGGGSGGVSSYLVSGNRAALSVMWGISTPVSAVAGEEYYSINVNVSGVKAVGPNACAGCTVPVCLALTMVGLVSQAQGTQTISNPLDRNFVTWQGSAVPGGCPAQVRVRNQTWGQIKSIYR